MKDIDIITLLWFIADKDGEDIRKLGLKGLVEAWVDLKYEVELIHDEDVKFDWDERLENAQ